MIRLDVGALDDLAPGTATRFEVGRHVVAVVRIDDDVYAIGDRCSHADVSLSEGEVDCEHRTLECWKHGSTFSLLTDECRAVVPPLRPFDAPGIPLRDVSCHHAEEAVGLPVA